MKDLLPLLPLFGGLLLFGAVRLGVWLGRDEERSRQEIERIRESLRREKVGR